MKPYVDFGYGSQDKLIARDGEWIVSQGFTLEQVGKNDPAISQAYFAKNKAQKKCASPHSGNSWECALNVAAVLLKHGWKTVADIPQDSPLYERVRPQAPRQNVYKRVASGE